MTAGRAKPSESKKNAAATFISLPRVQSLVRKFFNVGLFSMEMNEKNINKLCACKEMKELVMWQFRLPSK